MFGNTFVSKTAVAAGALLFAAALTNCGSGMKKIKTMPYPETAKVDVVDDYHGTKVADPYRWLEDDNSAETAAWIKAENEVTDDYLSQIPFRDLVRERLTQLWNYEKTGAPVKVGDYYVFFRNDGLQNQSVMYIKKGLDGEPSVLLDPNTLSSDGTVALGDVSFSEDGKYMAYGLASAGSDWVTLHVKEIPSGRDLPDVIKWLKFSGASWAADSKGFYYSAYDEPAESELLSGQNRNQKVMYHRLGTEQSADRLIYRDPEHPLRYLSGGESKDGRWIFISATEGTHGTEILFRPTKGNGRFRILFPGFDNDYAVVRAENDKAWVYTNAGAPNYRLVAIDLKNPSKGLSDVLPENKEHLLEGVSFVGGYIIGQYLEDATGRAYQYDMDGKPVRKIELPGIGTISGFGGKDKDTETFYTFTNFITPAEVYRYDLVTGKSEIYTRPELNYDPGMFMVEQVFYPSKDGTMIPMFVVHRKDMKFDGSNPTYLYGYGGFNVSLTPGFSPVYIALMEQGGVYALANLRGGGEYGEKWHRAGMLDKKQNVFDDFIAAGEFLIDREYTSKDKLAIAGGSNGGLLVGACMTQRPDLFAVAFPAVGVMDMLRFHLFTVGWGWAVEYGSSEDPEQFEYIYRYSPLHNIREGVEYPATLITTADHDDRVVPAHSFKFAAALQAAQAGDRPILIRIESNAGHSAGKPTSKRIAENSDVLSFLFYNTDTEYSPVK